MKKNDAEITRISILMDFKKDKTDINSVLSFLDKYWEFKDLPKVRWHNDTDIQSSG